VSHAGGPANNGGQDLFQIYSARNNPTNQYTANPNPSGTQPASNRKELKFSYSKENLEQQQQQMPPNVAQVVHASVSQNQIPTYNAQQAQMQHQTGAATSSG
jgi:hypothetical protein